jgi:Fe-S-cluster-containing dehydrogenase component/DMSO reductase anchor subunit
VSTTAIRSPLLRVTPAASSGLLEALFREQQTLTAVDRFAQQHGAAEARTYRDLIPLARPQPGQQYAFEVDLDSCTGCKACVAACHSLNGLEEDEVWRSVGLLHGGTAEAPAQQTVTTSCHHCVDPACLSGCPVQAYEKDPVTGIVRHLDDQCIGCQYCTLMCPYDAPKYSRAKGIVRKCDMCSDRLSAREAPACVQGCPNEAIAIRVIDKIQALMVSEANAFLPGAPAPDHTLPTTTYRSARAPAPNMVPADFYAVSPEHGHTPLVAMLVLTQLAVGAVAVASVASRIAAGGSSSLGPALLSLVVASIAMGASVFHLGRPLQAWRAFLGLRTSWLSREIIAFSLFAGAGAGYAASLAAQAVRLPGQALLLALRPLLEGATLVFGVAGVGCSVMVYAATRRRHWRGLLTGPRFFATALVLGIAAAHVMSTLGGAVHARFLTALMLATLGKLLAELSVLRHVRSREHTVMKRVALAMIGDLARFTFARFLCGFVGGLVIPLLTLLVLPDSGASGGVRVAAVAALALLVAGEMLERYLFFKAAPASRMPGSMP